VLFQKAFTPGAEPQRWAFYLTTDAENGSNSGSNFQLAAYSDAGAYLGSLFYAYRSSLTSAPTPYAWRSAKASWM